MERYLITTADERSWRFDQPVLFLGEWCRRYNRNHIWSKMDSLVAAPYALQHHKKQDLDTIHSLTVKILPELTEALNAFHKTQYPIRYWNIVLGHWLKRYISLTFNRYQVLTQALEQYTISGTAVFKIENYTLATSTSDSFVWATHNDQWNHIFFSKILMEYENPPVLIEPMVVTDTTNINPLKNNQETKYFDLKKTFKPIVRKICQPFSRNTDAFILNSYLPLQEEIKLQLSLGQMPQFWQTPEFTEAHINFETRKELKLTSSVNNTLESFIRKHLFETMPICFLEGYQTIVEYTERLKWPKKPRFIFTSNNFDTDEIFKIWTASKVNEGVPYFIGQHGNNYGTLLEADYYPEVSAIDPPFCDQFITWGWENKSSRKIPAFIFKTAKQKKKSFDPQGGLLFIQATLPHWLGPDDKYYSFGQFQEEQFKFVDTLSPELRQLLCVRLHHTYKKLPWFERTRWEEKYPDLRIENGNIHIKKLIRKSRLVIHSYDSTGLLECLALDIPTIAFWNHGFEHLIPEAIPYYQLLKDINILHDTPEQAADFIMQHWHNISTWWNNPVLQNKRKIFCHQYAREEKHPIQRLKAILKLQSQPINKISQ